ncbi:MAG: hypothetical protein ACE5DW_03630 [Thermodesulfobacteriota bacterium]
MKIKPLIPLIALPLVFTGCVKSSTFQKALDDNRTAMLQTTNAQEANKRLLEELATRKKEINELRTANEGLIEVDLKKSEQIVSLEARLKDKTLDNEGLRKLIEELRAKATATADKDTKCPDDICDAIYGELYRTLSEDIELGSISIVKGSDGLSLLIGQKALFKTVRASLLPEGKALLQRVSAARDFIKAKNKHIMVRTVMTSGEDKDNGDAWGLAAKRAAVVTRFLNERVDVMEASVSGLPYEDASGLNPDGYMEIIYPQSE